MQVYKHQKQNEILSTTIRKKIDNKNKPGKCLYFISSSEIDNKFKIGSTNNIEKRIIDLSTGSPYRFTVIDLYYTDCYIVLEETIKKFFSKYRITHNCEWYSLEIIHRIREFVNSYIILFNTYKDCSNIDEDVIKIVEDIENTLIPLDSKKCANCKDYININNYFKQQDGLGYIDICKNCFQIENMKGDDCKQCKDCHEIKYVYEFNIERASKDGLSYSCKDCKQHIRNKIKEEVDKQPETKIKGKKQCNICNNYYYTKMFFQTDEYTECKKCYCEKNGESKQCFTCKEIKKVFYFNNASQNNDGYAGSCKQCLQNKRIKISKTRKEILESENPGKKQCIKCEKYFKFHVFFKIFQDENKENFIYYDECRDCFTPKALQCNKCFDIKDVENFGIDKTKTTGRRTICKECVNERDRTRRLENSKEKIPQ